MSYVAVQLWWCFEISDKNGVCVCVSTLLFIYLSLVLTKATWALVSVTVSEVPAIMIAGTMAIVAVL